MWTYIRFYSNDHKLVAEGERYVFFIVWFLGCSFGFCIGYLIGLK